MLKEIILEIMFLKYFKASTSIHILLFIYFVFKIYMIKERKGKTVMLHNSEQLLKLCMQFLFQDSRKLSVEA